MNQLKKTESVSSIEAQLAWLYGRINYERQIKVTPRHFKLRNMREILGRIGNPHLAYRVVHVAGTKGKGSVCTMVGSILSAAGQKTGVYTSPHLETIHQRMAIDGTLISDDQLVTIIEFLKPVVSEIDAEAEKQGYRPLTFFEITTAAAFYFFAQQGCQSVVLEVGLGGRLDSTNVCQPDVCVITNISIDHTRQLGSTVDKIAFEKAGIIKSGVPVVSGATNPLAASVIKDVAAERGSPLFVLGTDFDVHDQDTRGFKCQGNVDIGSDDTSSESSYQYSDLELSLLGHHQRVNASLAISAVELLNQATLLNKVGQVIEKKNETAFVDETAIRQGLRATSLSGRTEVVSTSPTIVIDMAHNLASILALTETLKNDLENWSTSSKKSLIVAISRDKDAKEILQPLLTCFDEIVITKYQSNPRGCEPADLLEIASEIREELIKLGQPSARLSIAQTPEEAWSRVWENVEPDHTVCLTGSAFLVAELRKTVLAALNR